MYKIERQKRIREILEKNRHVNNQRLQKILKVSAVTIRNDLNELESEGFLIRTHGGAILPESHTTNKIHIGPTVVYDPVKEAIANIAIKFIRPNEWIFLGSGTTTYYVAHALTNHTNLKILTNNLLVAFELCANPSADVIVTSGTLSHKTHNLGGEIFSNFLHNITISKSFISISGLDYNGGYTVSTAGEFNVFQSIRNISKQLFIIMDNSKLDKIDFIKAGNLESADAVITDSPMPDKYQTFFTSKNIPVYTVKTDGGTFPIIP